eukprot:3043823-Amphidinium_carterae.1
MNFPARPKLSKEELTSFPPNKHSLTESPKAEAATAPPKFEMCKQNRQRTIGKLSGKTFQFSRSQLLWQ